MSDGAVLALVAVTLAAVVLVLRRLVTALERAELQLRRLVAGVWAARKAVVETAVLAADVERDAAGGREALERLDRFRRGDGDAPAGGAGPVALPQRPGPAPEGRA